MKVGIVGPISKDTVIWPNGAAMAKFGSVVYSAVALAKLFEGSPDEVVCLSHVSPDDAVEVNRLLAHPNIRLDFGVGADSEGAEITLRCIDQHERVSNQTRVMTPFAVQEVATLADCDFVILMPLNETDIGLEELRQFRSASPALIFLDVHGLITGVDKQGRRYKKAWARSDEWLKLIDVLKMNEQEASWAAGRFLDGFTAYLRFAAAVVRSGPDTCWITFGDRSSLVVWRRGGKVYWANVPVTDAGEVVDTVGCGDTASAGFVYAYARLHSPLLAVIIGNLLGSVKASTFAVSDLPTRPEVHSMIYQHYRVYLHELLDEFLSQQHLIVNELKEDGEDEGVMHGTDGDGHGHGADDARGGHSQGTAAPWA